MPDVIEPSTQHRPGTFTVQSARIAAAKSVAARIAKAQRKLAPAAAPLQAPLPTVDDYTKLRLVCVREQLGLVDRAILLESAKDHPDGQRLNWLASAQERLAEQERLLAGRPLPGSRKPLPERRPGSEDRPLQPVPCGPDTTTPSVNQQLPANEKPQDHSSQ